MKKIILFSIICLQLFSCSNKKNQNEKSSVLTEFDNSDYQIEIFYSKIDSVYSSIDSLRIFLKKKEIQTIDLKHKQINLKTNLISEMILPINNDFNFDGRNDIVTRGYSLPDFNYRSFHFLYDVKTKQFFESNSLDSLYNVQLNSSKQEICASYYNKNLGYFEKSKYKWHQNTLINIEKIAENESDGHVYLSIIKNNKVLVKDSIIKESFLKRMNCR